jgi:hypothetical protein
MTVPRRTVLWATAGASLLTALAVAPVIAGSASAGATLTGGCTATAHIDSQWGSGATGGEIVTVTVVNTSTMAGTTWAVSWTLAINQRLLTAWNASVTTSGSTATAVNTSYNGTLAPGASTTFGMQLGGTGPTPVMSCGNDAGPQNPGSGSATPPTGADTTVTSADNQTTVTLLLGQTLGVSLGADYRPPTTSGSGLTQLSTSGGYPTRQPLTALYRAVTTGTIDLISQTDYDCLHTQPRCAVPVTLWTVHVKVVPVPPTGGGQTVTVTTTANQSTVSLHVGDTLVVSLPSPYLPPTVSPSGALVASDVTGGYPTGQPMVAHYAAVAPGQVDVSTLTDAACNHQPLPCPSPQVRWVVHVTVTG